MGPGTPWPTPGNLISNAIKYSPRGGDVRISADAIEDCVTVRISDRGPGIASLQQQLLFQPYARLEQASAVRGWGLDCTSLEESSRPTAGKFGWRVRWGLAAPSASHFPVGRPSLKPRPCEIRRAADVGFLASADHGVRLCIGCATGSTAEHRSLAIRPGRIPWSSWGSLSRAAVETVLLLPIELDLAKPGHGSPCNISPGHSWWNPVGVTPGQDR
jgi:hypothetical protein